MTRYLAPILLTLILGSFVAFADEKPLSAEIVGGAELREEPRVPDRALLIKAAVLLDRAGFSPGAIDGSDNENLRAAISAFQKENGLAATGTLGQETWRRLEALSSEPATANYKLTELDLKGPFTPTIPENLRDQAGLPRLDYKSVVELVAEKFHMSEALVLALNSGRSFNSVGEMITVANVASKRKGRSKAAKIIVNKHERTLRLLDRSGKVVAFFPASVGGPKSPTPSGMLRVVQTVINPSYTYSPEFRFEGVQSRGKFRIGPGPNNPVGLVWIALNRRSYGIHGTPEPEGVSQTASQGCARLTNWDALRLMSMVRSRMPVQITD